jgi:hypothetical protein
LLGNALGLTMSDSLHDKTDPAFEREKWEADLRLREREIAIKEQELNAKIIEQNQDRWRSPLVLAILGAAVAAGGNVGLAWYNASAQREFEQTRSNAQLTLEQSRTQGQQMIEEAKAEAARILDMIKTAEPDKAAENLNFLVKSGLIENQTRRDKLERFLRERKPGEGPSLPSEMSPFKRSQWDISSLSAGNPIWYSRASETYRCQVKAGQSVGEFMGSVKSELKKLWSLYKLDYSIFEVDSLGGKVPDTSIEVSGDRFSHTFDFKFTDAKEFTINLNHDPKIMDKEIIDNIQSLHFLLVNPVLARFALRAVVRDPNCVPDPTASYAKSAPSK